MGAQARRLDGAKGAEGERGFIEGEVEGDGGEGGTVVGDTPAEARPCAVVFVLPDLVGGLVRVAVGAVGEGEAGDGFCGDGGKVVEELVGGVDAVEAEVRFGVEDGGGFVVHLVIDEEHCCGEFAVVVV